MAGMTLNVGIKNLKNGTQLSSIEVPEKLKQRIDTGIDFINDAMGGRGFTPSVCGLFTGTPGSGKTTMMLQLASSLASKHSSKAVLFNTAEESLYQTKMQAERLRIDTNFAVGQDIMINNVLKHANEIGAKFLILDSLQTLNDGKWGDKVNSKTPQRVLQMITEWCKENYTCALVIGQVNKDGKMAGNNVLKHMVDLHLHMSINQDPKSEWVGFREMEVEKNRFGASGLTYVLQLNERGLQEVA
jgi:DNA repair protein RadA/Sms